MSPNNESPPKVEDIMNNLVNGYLTDNFHIKSYFKLIDCPKVRNFIDFSSNKIRMSSKLISIHMAINIYTYGNLDTI